uniref:Uncharacterized protein n=1 Tax=Pediastrum duplex TaxID=3105 RepID=A0A2U8GIF9_PEDDU|nr:hypothetical protein [Pediastrum duplex]
MTIYSQKIENNFIFLSARFFFALFLHLCFFACFGSFHFGAVFASVQLHQLCRSRRLFAPSVRHSRIAEELTMSCLCIGVSVFHSFGLAWPNHRRTDSAPEARS